MMRVLYDMGIRLYYLVALVISPWNVKAKRWIKGRKGWKERLEKAFDEDERVAWFHCASLGEFEQGRPLMEAFREECPDMKILLSFFSPSGYEKRKDYDGADLVIYLPLDTAQNAKTLINLLPLELVVFVKYEFWYHMLRRLGKKGVPVYLASGIFRPGQLFFRWYGSWYRRFLKAFSHIFVQEETSRQILEQYGFTEVSIAGDTRFDRVKQVAALPFENRALEAFSENRTVLVAGSTWPPDEDLLQEAFQELPSEYRWIIAPHELSASHLQALEERFPHSIRFTAIGDEVPEDVRVVIVDTIGQLSYLYRYGTLAYIGGGFGKGIHNILEAATYGVPVIFGPKYQKFSEAKDLVALKGAFPVRNGEELLLTIHQQLDMNRLLKTSADTCRNFIIQRAGATQLILQKLCKKSTEDML